MILHHYVFKQVDRFEAYDYPILISSLFYLSFTATKLPLVGALDSESVTTTMLIYWAKI